MVVNLGNLNVHFIVDRSGSMGDKNKPVVVRGMNTKKTRFDYSREIFGSFVQQLGAYDDDGVDITFFNGGDPLKLVGVKPQRFDEEWAKITPQGGTNLSEALAYGIDLSMGRIQKNGEKNELLVVLLDGELDDADVNAVAQKIVNTTKKLRDRTQLGILFLQVGDDPKAKITLDIFDNEMRQRGAVLDIVSAKKLEDLENMTVEQLVDAAFSQ